MKHLFTHSAEKKSKVSARPYDAANLEPAVRCSICTGEKTAGFLNRHDGHFTEVMLIRTPKDEQKFKEEYKVDSLKVIY